MKRKVMQMILFCAIFNIFLLPVMAQEASTTGEPVIAEVTESTTAANSISDDDGDNRRFLSKWLHMIDSEGENNSANSSVIAYGMQAPADLARVLISTGGDKGIVGFLGVLLRSIAAIGFGFLFVLAAKLLFKDHIDKLKQLTPPNEDKLSLFWVNAIRQIPPITALVLLAVFSTLVFLLLAGSMRIEGRMVFQSILGIVLIFSICSMVGKIIFAPEDIYYAHRKVIVDFPTDNQENSTDEQTRNKALQAGAAAVIAAEAEEQKQSQ